MVLGEILAAGMVVIDRNVSLSLILDCVHKCDVYVHRPSSLLIPKQVRPPDPRSQSVFAVIYNDDDYVQVAPRPIKGLEIDSDITSDWSIPSSIEIFLAVP